MPTELRRSAKYETPPGLSARERPVVALVARYHRKEPPTRRQPEVTLLSDHDRRVVRRLASMLRIADGLDRGYTSVVERLRIRITRDRLRIGLVPRNRRSDLSLECWGAATKTDVLGKVLGREVLVVPAGT